MRVARIMGLKELSATELLDFECVAGMEMGGEFGGKGEWKAWELFTSPFFEGLDYAALWWFGRFDRC